VDDAERFREVAADHGGVPGEASPQVLTGLTLKGVPEPARTYLAGYFLRRSFRIGAVVFYNRRELLAANAEHVLPLVGRDGLLVVGECPNGDMVAVDVRDRLGAAGYICHERTSWVASARDIFAVLAPGLGALAAGLAAGSLPDDYPSAVAAGAAPDAEPGAAADGGA
jgi:hypothetical protein